MAFFLLDWRWCVKNGIVSLWTPCVGKLGVLKSGGVAAFRTNCNFMVPGKICTLIAHTYALIGYTCWSGNGSVLVLEVPLPLWEP